jgi:PTH1 family peptidyl-tRNA hydrolase
MKLVVGLGNPGKKYKRNRHNAGFLVLDELKSSISNFQSLSEPNGSPSRWPISNKLSNPKFQLNKKLACYLLRTANYMLAKPTTYMNESGKAVSSLATYYRLHATDIYVVYDDLDIKLGEYKIQRGKGPREHKGLLSIYEKLGSKDFWHVRVGVDNRESMLITDHRSLITPRPLGEDYVLQSFTDEEMEILESVIDRIVKDLYGRIKTSS